MILNPDQPDYHFFKTVIDQLDQEKTSVEKFVFNKSVTGNESFTKQFPIHSISLPEREEKPAQFDIRHRPQLELRCQIDYPGQSPFSRDQYWSLRQSGEKSQWFLSKNKGEDKSSEPFKRKLFDNPYQAIKAILEEFLANSGAFIKRKVEYLKETSF